MVDLPANTKQTITFQRYARKDKVTGAVTYGDWNATSGTYPLLPLQASQAIMQVPQNLTP